MSPNETLPITFGEPDEDVLRQLGRCLRTVPGSRGIICADSHKGYSQPIGGVVAYPHHVSPSGVGRDIACGNMAVLTGIHASELNVSSVMDEIYRVISFGMGRVNQEKVDAPVLEQITKSPVRPQASMVQMAANQLGTVGSGNHYVDLFVDDQGRLWIGVHFGSRGFGNKTCAGFVALAQGKEWGDKVKDGMDDDPVLLDTRTPLGEDYIEAMKIAGAYAYAGREWVVARVLKILGMEIDDCPTVVHNHHNFAWREEHGGEHYWVIRKGATPAFPGQCGFVGGSMGGISVVLEGVESERSREALYSTVHGAGRVMSRNQAKGKTKHRKVWACGQRDCDGTLPIQIKLPDGGGNPRCQVEGCGGKMHKRRYEERVSKGCVDWPTVKAHIASLGIELRGGGADEAPEVYKHLPDVLAHHDGTVRILHTLTPLGVAMASKDVVDPFRD